MVYLPAIYVAGLVDAERRFLNCMKINYATLLITILGTILHIFWCYLFVDIYQMDIYGIGYACLVTNIVMYAQIKLYSSYITKGVNLVSVTYEGIKEQFWLGAPCALMVSLEWWAYQVMSIMSGYFGVSAQAAQQVLSNIAGILFMVSLGC